MPRKITVIIDTSIVSLETMTRRCFIVVSDTWVQIYALGSADDPGFPGWFIVDGLRGMRSGSRRRFYRKIIDSVIDAVSMTFADEVVFIAPRCILEWMGAPLSDRLDGMGVPMSEVALGDTGRFDTKSFVVPFDGIGLSVRGHTYPATAQQAA